MLLGYLIALLRLVAFLAPTSGSASERDNGDIPSADFTTQVLGFVIELAFEPIPRFITNITKFN